jgi:hypothetical protein
MFQKTAIGDALSQVVLSVVVSALFVYWLAARTELHSLLRVWNVLQRVSD